MSDPLHSGVTRRLSGSSVVPPGHRPPPPLGASLIALAGFIALAALAGCKRVAPEEVGHRILHMPLRAKVGNLDPVRGGTQYSSMAQAVVYEPLFQYDYLKRPLELVPRLLTRMPTISADGTVYDFELKEGIRFHDDPCFEGGKGRVVESSDFLYSMRRMADRSNGPNGWWIYADRIVGFDEYQAAQDKRPEGTAFDYQAPVSGLTAIDARRFRITLKRPYPQFLYVLAMQYTAVVPREAVTHYGEEFGAHPVGTGPFRFVSWVRGSKLEFVRNPTFREEYYPTEGMPGDKEAGLLRHAGERIPLLDGIAMHVFEQEQPMWLKWRVGDIDFVQVPAEYYDSVFEKGVVRESFTRDGVGGFPLPLLDFIYRGFNMEDPIFGGFGKGKLLRQAISLAIDTAEINDAFYNNTNILYDGPIPPGLDGYEAGVRSPYRGPNLDKARALLAEAGYPEGKGLPALNLETDRSGSSREQADMVTRQLKAIGVTLNVNFNSFPELDEKLKRKKGQLFGLAWGSDYPDAENNLALFYGPNEAPGSNNWNYKNPKYDALYEQIRTMQPSPERSAIYRQMRDILIEDCPSMGSMARTRNYVWNGRLHGMKPQETWYGWLKYLSVDPR